LVAAG
jgi:hypothetical protein